VKSRHVNDLRVARLRLRKPGTSKIPMLNRQAIDACAQIVTHAERFPELGSGRGQKRFLFGQPNRERHLVRLEAIAKVLGCLLSHMDLVTLRAGKRRRDGSCDAIRSCKPYGKRATARRPAQSQATVEEETQLGRNAVERALRDLETAGYVSSHQPKRDYRDMNGDRQWRSFPSVRTITKTCLKRLGIDLQWLDQQGRLARLRQEEGPKPIVDVRLVRERQRMVRGQAIAAKQAQIASARAERMVTASAARVARMYRRTE
jgi:hypothetical protein